MYSKCRQICNYLQTSLAIEIASRHNRRASVNHESAKQKLQQTTPQFFSFYLLKKIKFDVLCESSHEISSRNFSEKQ